LTTQQRLSYPVYLERLARLPVDRILRRRAGDAYPVGVAEAILLAVSTAEDRDPDGVAGLVLRMMSVLSAEGVERAVLHGLAYLTASQVPAAESLEVGLANASVEAIDQALGRLADASLLTCSQTGEVWRMHRLVGRVIRERDHGTEEPGAALRVVAALLDALRIPDDQAWRHRQAGTRLVEQVSSAWATAVSLHTRGSDQAAGNGLMEELADLRNWSVRHLTDTADIARAISIGTTALTDCERLLGPEHPDTLTSRNNLAYAYRSAGRLGEAIPLYEQTLADRERLLGPEHPDTLTSRNNLAYAYESAGRLDEATRTPGQKTAVRRLLAVLKRSNGRPLP
jgi:YD repeat-containing protein